MLCSRWSNETPRLLKADEISVRVQSISDNGGAVFLPYKDARVDMAILDEAWPDELMRTHEAIDGKMFCTISVGTMLRNAACYDVGVESTMDAIKGEASDAFKRADKLGYWSRIVHRAVHICVSQRR